MGSELQLYLFGLGCNLTKKQMIELSSTGGELDEAAARAAFIKYRDEELVTLDQIMNVFRTWDSTNSGTVPYSTIMAEVGDGNDMCPFDGAVKGLFDRILSQLGTPISSDNFDYREFAKVMADTMPMQCGKDKAPIKFESDLLNCKFD